VCLAALLLAWRGLPATPGRAGARLDTIGLLLLSPSLAAIVYGLAQVGAYGGFGHVRVVAPVAVGAALLAAFVWHALRTPGEPLVDLRLFRDRGFAASSTLLFLSGISLYGAMLLLPLYYQQVHGTDAIGAGLLLAPQGVGALISRGWLGKLTDLRGPRPVILGCVAVTALGTLGFTQAGGGTDELLLALSLVVRGAGLGGITMAVMSAAYQGLGRDQIPHASGATRITQQIGASFGAAVLAVILQRQIATHPADAAGLAVAFDQAFWWAFALSLLPVIPALLLPGRTPEGGERAWATGRGSGPAAQVDGTGVVTGQPMRPGGSSPQFGGPAGGIGPLPGGGSGVSGG
jgi:predicted MFS family arabinose efflux permease